MLDSIFRRNSKSARKRQVASAPAPAPARSAQATRSTLDTWAAPTLLSPGWGARGGAYGRLARLHDGGLVGSLTTWQNGQQYLRVSRAAREDHGSTPPLLQFLDIGTIAQGKGDIDNVHMVQLDQTAPGASAPRLLATFRNHDHHGGHPAQIYRITVCRSDNSGRDWVYHSEVTCTRPPHGVWEPFFFKPSDNSLHVYYARENANHSQNVVMQRSTDGGMHWQAPLLVAPIGGRGRDGMPGVALYHDGRAASMFAVFESNENGPFCIMGAKSADQGQHWTHRAPVYTPLNGRHAGAPQVAYVDGRLVVVFMTDEDAQRSEWPKNACIKAVVALTTTPNRITWSQPCSVSPQPAFWPGAFNGGDDCLYLTYDNLAVALPLDGLLPAQQDGFNRARAT